MKVSESMSQNPTMITPNQTLLEAAKQMATLHVGSLPVSDKDRIVGIVTDRDIAVRGIAAGKGPKSKVSEVMTERVKYCFDDQSIEEVAQEMSKLGVRRLPVVNRDKRLVGILSLGDIAKKDGDGRTAGSALRELATLNAA